jgi:hypothetical protein
MDLSGNVECGALKNETVLDVVFQDGKVLAKSWQLIWSFRSYLNLLCSFISLAIWIVRNERFDDLNIEKSGPLGLVIDSNWDPESVESLKGKLSSIISIHERERPDFAWIAKATETVSADEHVM